MASLGVISGCSKDVGSTAAPAPEVSVATVVERRVKDWDEFTGRLEAVDSVEVRARVSGYLEKVAFKEGSPVKEGDLLFIIDPRPYRAEYDRATADLKRLRNALELAQMESGRVLQLKENGAVSQEELDERGSSVAQAQANVAAAAALVEAAALNLEFTKVTSPIAGRTGKAEVTRGNLVSGGSNGGTLLSSVVSMDPVYLYFDADEQSYLRYTQMARSGERPSSRDAANPVQVGLADEEGFPHAGSMDFVNNQVDSKTGTIRARAVLPNKDGRFTPGLFARVRLLGSGEYSAVLIDDRAVGTEQSQKYVLALGKDNRVEYRQVQLGRLIDGLRIVRAGLKPGDVIVVNGIQRVQAGATVNPKVVAMASVAAASPLAAAAPP